MSAPLFPYWSRRPTRREMWRMRLSRRYWYCRTWWWCFALRHPVNEIRRRKMERRWVKR